MLNLLVAAFDFAGIFKTVVTKWYYYVIALVLLGGVICCLVFCRPKKRNNLSKTEKLCYIAVLSALHAVVNIFDINIGDTIQLSFVAAVGFIAGYLLGGGYAFLICFIGDLIGAIIAPHGAYNPIIAFGTCLWGFIPGVLYSHFNGNKYVKLIISFLICSVVVSAGCNTLGVWLMYGLGKHTFLFYLADMPVKLLSVLVNAIICVPLIKILPKILPKNKFTLD
ncbi:MAG: folate family ECF transporter S component [Clostridia bacterium]|nr:folate family ECF transporter S component [Clostridia bacterium]